MIYKLLEQAKPILFNTEMVQAILDGRKTVTRRVVKYDFDKVYKSTRFHWKWGKTYSEEIPTDIIDWYANEIAKPSMVFERIFLHVN